jgi:hypothetical protein
MKNILALVGSIVAAVSFVPYLIDTVKQTVKPRIASWMTWSLVTGISTVAALTAHAYVSALLTGAATLVELSVLALALRNGDRTYKWLDAASQATSAIGIVAWLLSRNPAAAILFSIMADFFGAVPTYYHGWVTPHEEQWQSFVIFGFGSLLTVFAVTTYNFINLAFPVYFSITATTIGADIFFRQRVVKKPTI